MARTRLLDVSRLDFDADVRMPSPRAQALEPDLEGVRSGVLRLREEVDVRLPMIGDYNARRARVSFGGPISDGILGQISALYNSRDGFTYNRLLGTRLNDVDNASARVALRFLPNDDTTIDLAVEYARDRAFGRANDVGDPEMTLRLEDMPYFVERGTAAARETAAGVLADVRAVFHLDVVMHAG